MTLARPALLLAAALVLAATPCLALEQAPRSATGTRGAVAAAHPLAVEAALDMLERGGNAVDAAAAAAFALGVVEPFGSGIGGDGVALVYSAATDQVVAYTYRCTGPHGVTEAQWFEHNEGGWDNARGPATPGMVAGTLMLHEDFGSLPLADVMAPAIRHATDGFPVGPTLAGILFDSFGKLSANEATAEIFLPGGLPPETGATLRNPDLAGSLSLIAEGGRDAYYNGPIGAAIAGHLQAEGGWLTVDDFARYKAHRREALSLGYRGFEIHSAPLPFGGLGVLLNLNVLEHSSFDPALPLSEPLNLHAYIESMRLSMQDRYAVSGDPEFVDAPVAELLSKEYGARRAGEILTDRALRRSEIKPGLELVGAGSGSTTHLSVVDAEGNAVSLTQTLGGFFGCGTTIPGTGIVMNDQMKNFSRLDGSPNRFAPGKAMNSTQAPTIVMRDGELEFVIGSPGNYRILTTVVQMLVMRLDQGMDLAAATVAPRIAARHYGAIDVEGGWPDGTSEALEARGHEVATHPEMDLYFGGTHAITRDPATGVLHAVADPRRDGDAGAIP